MASRYVIVDRETAMLLPPDLKEWVAGNDLVHLVVEAVGMCEMGKAQINSRGTGDRQYPPAMMLALLIYSYASGTFSSRGIERQSYESVAVRYVCANTHPDHDTIAKFRRENEERIHECFVRVLELAREMGFCAGEPSRWMGRRSKRGPRASTRWRAGNWSAKCAGICKRRGAPMREMIPVPEARCCPQSWGRPALGWPGCVKPSSGWPHDKSSEKKMLRGREAGRRV
jgi:transposase